MTLRHAPLLGVVATLLVLAGCGNAPPPGVAPEVATTGHTLTVRTDIRPGAHGMMFIEGALPEVRLVARTGSALRPVHDHTDTAVFRDLAPGRYRLTASLRPCDGNCGYLDAPQGTCHAIVHIPRDANLLVSWRVGHDCHVT